MCNKITKLYFKKKRLINNLEALISLRQTTVSAVVSEIIINEVNITINNTRNVKYGRPL